jgi:hypothetical protein
MSNLILQDNSDSANRPRQLTRRQALALLVTAPFALTRLPAPALPAVAGDPLTDRAAFLALVLIPLHEELLATARRELAALGGAR